MNVSINFNYIEYQRANIAVLIGFQGISDVYIVGKKNVSIPVDPCTIYIVVVKRSPIIAFGLPVT